MRELLSNRPEVFGVFKKDLKEAFNVSNTPDISLLVFLFIGHRVCDRHGAGLIVNQ